MRCGNHPDNSVVIEMTDVILTADSMVIRITDAMHRLVFIEVIMNVKVAVMLKII